MNQTIGVNITPQSFQPTLHYSQGDVGRVFVINVTDYDIPTGATVTCVATKPSGMGFTVSGTVSGNSVTFTSTAEMTDEWGRFPAEIRIASGNTLLGTANFLMIGEKDPHPASTIDGTQEELIPQLTLLVNRVEAAAESVHDLTVSATTLAAGSDATATYDSANNSIAFGIPRGADGDVTRSEFNDLKSDLNEVYYTATYNALTTGRKTIAFSASNGDVVRVTNTSGQALAFNLRETDSGTNIYSATIAANSTSELTLSLTTNANYASCFFNATGSVIIRNLSKGYVNSIRELQTAVGVASLNTLETFVPFYAGKNNVIFVYSDDGSNMTPTQVQFWNENGNTGAYINLSGFGPSRIVQIGNYFGTKAKLVGGTAQKINILNLSTFMGDFVNDINSRLDVLESQKISDIVTKYITNETAVDRGNIQKNSDFKCLFFSDVHASQVNVERIISFANTLGSANLNAVINGGDTVNSLITEDVAWYTSLANTSNIDVLDCIGNHDAWETAWITADGTVPYNKLIAPMVSRVSNIVQPTNASTEGLCYYYKDYGDIRVVVLAGMWYDSNNVYWTTAQKTWFESVLADAITNSKAVICVNHAPFGKDVAEIDADLPLNSWRDYFTTPTIDPIQLAQEAVDAVHTFIQNGGEFICWLTGHVHQDMVMMEKTYNDQFMINIATARYNYHGDSYSPTASMTYDDAFDCFDYIGVDTTNKMLKVWRIGYSEDASMRVRHRFGYDYANLKLLSYS